MGISFARWTPDFNSKSCDTMDWEKLDLSPKIINALKKGRHVSSYRNELKWTSRITFKRLLEFIDLIWIFPANVTSARKILSVPAADLQRLLHLSDSEVQLVQTAVAARARPVPPVTGRHIPHLMRQFSKPDLGSELACLTIRKSTSFSGHVQGQKSSCSVLNVIITNTCRSDWLLQCITGWLDCRCSGCLG